MDQLRHLLVTCAGGESEEVERFFKLHRVRIQNQVFDYISKMDPYINDRDFKRYYERPHSQMCLLRATTDVAHKTYYGSAALMYQGSDSSRLSSLVYTATCTLVHISSTPIISVLGNPCVCATMTTLLKGLLRV